MVLSRIGKAYSMREKKGKKVQRGLMPVLYERAIECAASEQKTKHGWQVPALPCVDLGGLPRFSGG